MGIKEALEGKKNGVFLQKRANLVAECKIIESSIKKSKSTFMKADPAKFSQRFPTTRSVGFV